MPTPSGRYKNWSGVVFTPTAGSPIPLLGVTDLQIDPRGQVVAGAGDADLGPSAKHLISEDPQVTVEFEHLEALRAVSPGMRGTLTAIHNDADNEEGTGAMEYTISNCIIVNTPRGGRFRAYGTSRITIETWRPDGRTHPISITIAA